MLNPDFHAIITSAAKDMADTMDEQILKFFGSEENVKAYVHLFVIEQLPLGVAIVPSAIDNPQFIFHAETEIRIRPKTMKELEAEKSGES